jgi:hypothetical protein
MTQYRIDDINDINDPSEVAEKASYALYRARAMLCSAIAVSEAGNGYFESAEFKQVGLLYQLEDIYQWVKQYETLFDETVNALLQHPPQREI